MARGRKRKSLWWWVLMCVGVPFALAVVMWFVSNAASKRALERELARLKASGAPLTLAEAAPKPVPDDQNAAVLYEQAFAYMQPAGGDDSMLLSRFLSLKDPAAKEFSYFVSGGQATASVRDVEEIFSRYAPAFPLLEQAAARPACRFAVDWNAGYNAMFPHLGRLRQSARLLAAKAIIEARRGNSGKGLDDIAIIFRMGDHICAEPTLIAQLVRFALQSIGIKALNRVVEIAPPSAEEAKRMCETLGRIDEVRPFTHAIEGERCMGLWFFDSVRRDPKQALEVWTLYGRVAAELGTRLGPVAPQIVVAAMPLVNRDEVFYIRHMHAQVALSRLPYRDATAGFDAQAKQVDALPKWAVLTKVALPVFSRATQARDRGMALIGVGQWGMALRAYQVQVGRYPDSLAQLRERIKWALPVDPFSGKDFVYRKKGAGYLLYSIGQNMKDEGGLDRSTGKWQRGKEPPDDIAWRITH